MGKGDKPRPKSISEQEFRGNWDKIFGKKEVGCPFKNDCCNVCQNMCLNLAGGDKCCIHNGGCK